MLESAVRDLNPVAETLLVPLYARAIESLRPDALLRDEVAVALVARMDSLFPRLRRTRMDSKDQLSIILRNREFDDCARGFLARYPDATVVHIGCGLDARFERVDNGRVEWYDLDLPEVIELRKRFIGGEGARYHLLACSAFDRAWMDAVSAGGQRPVLVLAEGVLMYFEEVRVRSLVLALRERFPGAEMVCDVFSPFLVWAHNLHVSLSRGGIGARYQWTARRAQDVESWSSGICLLHEWFLYDRPEPRLPGAQVVRWAPFLARGMGVAHYRLGNVAG